MQVAVRSHRPLAARMLVLALVALLWLSTAGPATGQQNDAPTLEILSVHHDSSGTLSIALRAEGSREIEIRSLTAFVNDVPVSLDVTPVGETDPLALVLVIDTSGSMAGVPMSAARQAAKLLVEQLPSGDRIALSSFDSTPVVRTGLTADSNAVSAMIDTLRAAGATALYEAVIASAELIEAAEEPQKVMVLLSDGQDTVSPGAREESITRAAEAGVRVYAVGFGPDYDGEYLSRLAEATGGQFSSIPNEFDGAALAALFTRIGGQLGSREVYEIPVSPMVLGEHRLRVRGVINDQLATAEAPFDVTNAGLVRAAVESAASDGDVITLRLETGVAPSELTLEARIGDRVFRPSASAAAIALDPWRLAPGEHTVEVVAIVRGEVAAREMVEVTVPQLAPVLTVTERGSELVARGRVQQAEPPVVVATVDGEEIGRGTRGELVVERGSSDIVFTLVDLSGDGVTTQQVAGISADVAAGGTFPTLLVLLLMVLGGVAMLLWLRRRRRTAAPKPAVKPVTRIAPRSRPSPPEGVEGHNAPRETRIGTVLVRDAEGYERSLPLTRRPLTIGSAPLCDIVLDDPDIRPEHARLTPLPTGEVQIHALAHRGARPYEVGHSAEDEWLLIQHGEQVALGTHVISVLLDDGGQAGEPTPPESADRAS